MRAWVRSDSLDEAGQVLGDTCFLSAGAGDFFTPYFHVPQGTRLKRIGAPTDGWTQVQPPENASAWVHADYVSLDEEREASQEDATIADALPGALAKQREELKKEHAKQQELLLEEQQNWPCCANKPSNCKKQPGGRRRPEKLQREAERLQALKEAAEAKAELARLQREKAGIQAEAEQNKLEALKRQAEESSAQRD